MKDLDVSSDPADYIYGPTGNIGARTNGGTNKEGGVSVVEVSEEPLNGSAAAPTETATPSTDQQPPAQPPAPPQQ